MSRVLMKSAVCLAAVVALLADARPASAGFLNTIDRGWYDLSGTHDPVNDNYIAGYHQENLHRNFFVFDLGSQTDPVTSARLSLFNPLENKFQGSATYTLYDVTTAIPTLTAGLGGIAAFNDLGTGLVYGSVTVTGADAGTFIVIHLNANGLAAVNANLGGQLAVGGNLVSNQSLLFGYTYRGNPRDGNTQLFAESASQNVVPAPPAVLLAAIGSFSLIGYGLLRRRGRIDR